MDEVTKQQLLEQFRSYLDREDLDHTSDQPDPPTTDLFSLFTELAGLRNEVKLEARQFKTALDQFKTVVDQLQTAQTGWRQELETREQKRRREMTKTFLLEVLEVYDRLAASLTTLNNYQPPRWTWWCTREISFIRSVSTGQAMTLRRCEQLLARYQVRPLEVLHHSLDPHCMRAVETDSQPKVENGIVTAELRKGFMWEEELLRPAEVKVNKIS